MIKLISPLGGGVRREFLGNRSAKLIHDLPVGFLFGQVVPFVGILGMIVQFLRSIAVADITEPLGTHGALPALVLGHGRKIPRHFRVLQKRNDARPIKIFSWFQSAEFDQGRVYAKGIDWSTASRPPLVKPGTEIMKGMRVASSQSVLLCQ